MPPPDARAQLQLERLEDRENPSGTVPVNSLTFLGPNLSAGWVAWSSNATSDVATDAGVGVGGTAGVTVSGTSRSVARTWNDAAVDPDSRVSVSAFADSSIPAEVFARGQNLGTSTPSYLAAVVTRGLTAELWQVTNGQAEVLGSLRSPNAVYLSGQWVRVSLVPNGTTASVTVVRQDTGQYLNAQGTWQATPASALTATVAHATGVGQVGFGREARYAGTVRFDDFNTQLPATPAPPQVTVQASGNHSSAGYSGTVTFQATAFSVTAAVRQVDFVWNGAVQASTKSAAGSWSFDTTKVTNGSYTLTVRATDAAGRVGTNNFSFIVNHATANPDPTAPQHYPNIRIAELAYSGNPMGDAEQSLLRNSVDLVVANPQYFRAINATAPNTPQLIYSNLSNLYGGLLTSWLEYAKAYKLSPEDAFYHVAQATPFTGASPSSQPVTWFWSVYQSGAANGMATDLTAAAHSNGSSINWGAAGQTLTLGYTDPFREVNVTIAKRAAAGWAGVWEYAAQGANGSIVWKSLPLLKDGTVGLTRTGTITFDLPAGWVSSAATNGASPYYSIRFRVTSGTVAQAAVSTSLLGRDYVNANGGQAGTIPAFDYAADTNHDGYLSDAEYANREPGMDARFVYESRLFYPYYGQMRFVTNPSSPVVQQWAASFDAQVLNANPLANGLFLDNSQGKLPFAGTPVLESTTGYSADFGKMVNAVHQAVGAKWVVTNVAGGTTTSFAAVAHASTAAFEEGLLRPMTATWSSVGDVANAVNQILNADGTPYAILDSSSVGGSPTDARTQVATLAYYYLLGDPTRTFLMLYGGDSPATSWSQHWSAAASVNIGQPKGGMTVFATGKDPTNSKLTYEVLSRNYSDGLVLYKPLSYAVGVGKGTTADNTATAVPLGGKYYVVNADGSVSKTAVSSVVLRNGEGTILIKA